MKKEIVRINGVLRRYSAVIAAGLLILQAGAASAEDLKTEQDSQDEYNLLKNGGFEMADELSPNYPKDWDYRHFVSDSAPLDWEFA
ncbi:MAG: hypothetical protein PHP98_10805, partial [Kiritimatiellae bacterium]|nr:hypothetical protein [Kiritimatiellia bacterium]